MKQYPSIPAQINYDVPVYVYEKLDGSNIRAEWSRKQGRKSGDFYKFGSRKVLLSTQSGIIHNARDLILELQDEISKFLIDVKRADRAICYFEFHGPNSFAGFHEEKDEHKVSLLDIEVYKRGFIDQKEYCKFANSYWVHTPMLLDHRKIDKEYEQEIRSGNVGTFEGVVCKSMTIDKKSKKPIKFKIKNQAWINKVKSKHADNPKLLAELL